MLLKQSLNLDKDSGKFSRNNNFIDEKILSQKNVRHPDIGGLETEIKPYNSFLK